MSLATVASVVGIAAGANALFGGTGGGGGFGGTGAYTPSDQPGADTAWQQALQQEQGALGTQNQNLSPQYLSNIFQVNQQAMPNVQGFYNAAGQQLANESNVNSNAQNMQMGVGNTVWNTAQDPQNALYNQSLQQVQDQSRAASSLRGIGMGGEAAGLRTRRRATSISTGRISNSPAKRRVRRRSGSNTRGPRSKARTWERI